MPKKKASQTLLPLCWFSCAKSPRLVQYHQLQVHHPHLITPACTVSQLPSSVCSTLLVVLWACVPRLGAAAADGGCSPVLAGIPPLVCQSTHYTHSTIGSFLLVMQLINIQMQLPKKMQLSRQILYVGVKA
ncbi:hypothetical protein K439DRAFT_1619237 [Ramaria rubella]|nr:hypothetical protein K439DRAFT_1619237 [Ramaria rubella]